MKHTYIYENRNWKANGVYYDGEGKEIPLYGEVAVIHNEKEWSLGGFLEVRYDVPVRFTNDYNFRFSDTEGTLIWQSYNPALGILKGKMEVIGNYLISSYQSEDGVYSGTETLICVDSNTYQNAGVSFLSGRKMSSWTAELVSV